MRMVRKGAWALAMTLGCGLAVWFGIALSMEIADSESATASEAAYHTV